jgi:hypothetical protein
MIGYCNAWLRINGDCSFLASNNACLSSGGDWINASDRNIKENFSQLDSSAILSKINNLPITKWNYKTEDASITHIGPMAQDFYAEFGVGGSDKSISTIDPAGIALIGIQELSKQQASTTLAITNLNLRLDSLLPLNATSTPASFITSLQSFEASIIDGIVHFAEVIIGKLTVSHFTIKNEANVNKTGYVIYDRATGQPICVYFENGTQKTAPGDCEDTGNENTSNEVSNSNSSNSGGEEIVGDTGTTTPIVSDPAVDTTSVSEPQPEPQVTTEPEIVPEPTPEPEPQPTPNPAPTE